MSNPEFQPAMNKKFRNADEFFGRSVDEYKQWLINNSREQLDFILMDLIRLSKDRIVLCDCHLTMEQVEQLSDPSRVAFMIKEPTRIIEDYCNRKDHQDFDRFINSCTDVTKAKETCNATLMELNLFTYHNVKKSKYFWYERTADTTVQSAVFAVEKHFKF